MAIGRCFEEALQKAIRMVSDGNSGFEPGLFKGADELTEMKVPTPNRLFAIAVRRSPDSLHAIKGHSPPASRHTPPSSRYCLCQVSNIAASVRHTTHDVPLNAEHDVLG